jgi:hypothetical protein
LFIVLFIGLLPENFAEELAEVCEVSGNACKILQGKRGKCLQKLAEVDGLGIRLAKVKKKCGFVVSELTRKD